MKAVGRREVYSFFLWQGAREGNLLYQIIVTYCVKNPLAQNSEIHANGIFFYVGINNILQTHRINTKRQFF
jgi:hypothetical protein